MAQVDIRERQLILKVVYYGPPLSGKTTNIQWIHSQVDELNRGRLMTLDTRDDRTLFFDLLPIFFKESNLSFRVKVYTVPGQPLHAATRRVVLRGTDGVVFVADSRRSEIRANNESYQELLANLESEGVDSARAPVVIQYNKRDLPDTLSDAEVASFSEANPEQTYRASAIVGDGVLETFFGVLERVWRTLDKEIGLERGFGLAEAEFVAALKAHLRGG
jgi:signal recognition particle receptor subunit beta